ncbi:MAG: pathogenesis-related protein 1 [Verrucomicrobiales bacterium]|jgi:pathogenesis-related protein 1
MQICPPVVLVGLLIWIAGFSPTQAQNSSGLTAEERKNMVDFHNKVRAEVGVDKVTWSDELARFAKEWADELSRRGKFEHRPRIGEWKSTYGENLGMGSDRTYDAIDASKAWHEEIKFYKPGKPIPQIFAGFKAGHYTQMVWKDTTEIGAGKAVIRGGRYDGWTVVVCNYNPPGNYKGQLPYEPK